MSTHIHIHTVRDETSWIEVSFALLAQLQVGKTYMFDGRKGTITEKSEGGHEKSAVGLSTGRPMVRVKWK